ncbi:hypothetical protein [Longitalea arenae]|uniref:hypothetical protein n=1 Tax=Longitalea arenae TaxID=2812558 RepID=UPI0019672FB6|nr:hypothetical protein [Longitalea arenae]
MKLNNLRKFSILGLALLATSAVVAAFVPSSKSTDSTALNGPGSLTQAGTDNTATCATVQSNPNCNNTVTEGDAGSSSAGGTTSADLNRNTTLAE